jgi:hypothetical protein
MLDEMAQSGILDVLKAGVDGLTASINALRNSSSWFQNDLKTTNENDPEILARKLDIEKLYGAGISDEAKLSLARQLNWEEKRRVELQREFIKLKQDEAKQQTLAYKVAGNLGYNITPAWWHKNIDSKLGFGTGVPNYAGQEDWIEKRLVAEREQFYPRPMDLGISVDTIAMPRKEKRDTRFSRDSIWGRMLGGAENATSKFSKEADKWKEIGMETAKSMSSTFNTFFVDVIEGRMKSFSDYLLSFLKDIASALSRIMSQMIVESAVKGIGGLFQPATPSGGASNKAMRVEVINQSGQPVQGNAKTSRDAGGLVLSIVLDAINRDKGGMRTAIKGVK